MSELQRLQNRIEAKLHRADLQDLHTVNANYEKILAIFKSMAKSFYETIQKEEADFRALEDRVKALEDKIAGS